MKNIAAFCLTCMLLMLTATLTCANDLADTQAKLKLNSQVYVSYNPKFFEELEHKSKQYDLRFSDGTVVHVSIPEVISSIGKELEESLVHIHNKLQLLLGITHRFRTSLILFPKKEFYSKTGAPSWTSAIFFRNKIKIPVDVNNIDLVEIKRTIWHEYTHAMIQSISGGNCPGWIDEGIAQLLEGPEHPALQSVLRDWLYKKEPVQLSLLKGGFTELDTDMVAPAYAQSMFATELLLSSKSFKSLGYYLLSLRDKKRRDSSFKKAFGYSEQDFESLLNYKLKNWSFRSSSIRRLSTYN